ncbi:MAG: insulinase family protein, partial [Pseudomonadota bacterium]
AELKSKKDKDDLYHAKPRYGRNVKIYGNSEDPIFMIVFRGDPLGTRRAFVMDILANTLGVGSSSYLMQKYVKGDKPLLNTISVGNYNMKKDGVFYIMGEVLNKVSWDRFYRQFTHDMGKFCELAVDDRSVQKVKNQYLIGYYQELNTNEGMASFLGTRESLFGDFEYYRQELATYASIVPSEVRKVCQDIFTHPQYIALTVWKNNPMDKSDKDDQKKAKENTNQQKQ